MLEIHVSGMVDVSFLHDEERVEGTDDRVEMRARRNSERDIHEIEY